MKIFLIGPVRGGVPKDSYDYVALQEQIGNTVHFPPRDVQQDDPTGHSICSKHRDAMIECDEVHVIWDSSSYGSHFDLGMAFALRKKLRLVKSIWPDVEGKSYLKVMDVWQS